MSTPPLFDATPEPVRGHPWPWPTPPGFDVVSHDHCTAIAPGWRYCARDRDHDGPHAEARWDRTVGHVWEQS